MAGQRIHFIGGGQMAEAIIRAIISNQTTAAEHISVAAV
ncbi:NAD(P)-binding domain-containing protein [Paenibacillus sp. URB8-2]|nr:NAD(P)-binding domain-containing protein [Paenibacillus sp. URB8-2]